MDTIGSDVLSRYPLLSQKLRNMYLSKQIHEDTLQGSCDAPIINRKVLSLFQRHGQRVFFSRESSISEITFKATIINKFPFDMKIYMTAPSLVYHVFGQEFNIFEPHKSQVISYNDLFIELEDFIDNPSSYFDVLTIREYYSERVQCKLENYVRNKTLKYFNNVVNELKNQQTNLELYFYLSVNCYILSIPFDYQTLRLSYDQYDEHKLRIDDINNMLIGKISNHIERL
jgi:hypothetical protein